MLLNAGADVNTQGGGYGMALQAASADGHMQVVHMLLGWGANPGPTRANQSGLSKR